MDEGVAMNRQNTKTQRSKLGPGPPPRDKKVGKQPIANLITKRTRPRSERVKPARTPRQPAQRPVLSEGARLALGIIKQVMVRACEDGAYYWSDYLMQQVCKISKSVIRELRKIDAIRCDYGVFTAVTA
jgi:hypothetical protein